MFDTDLISTVVYSRYYYGDCPAWVIEEARRHRADLYLLMDTDVAWKPDEARVSRIVFIGRNIPESWVRSVLELLEIEVKAALKARSRAVV